MAKVYVGVEGFLLKSGYIVKELSYVYEDDRRDHYRFAAPEGLFLTPAEALTVRYVSKNLNGLSLNDIGIKYDQLHDIVSQLSGKRCFRPFFFFVTLVLSSL